MLVPIFDPGTSTPPDPCPPLNNFSDDRCESERSKSVSDDNTSAGADAGKSLGNCDDGDYDDYGNDDDVVLPASAPPPPPPGPDADGEKNCC